MALILENPRLSGILNVDEVNGNFKSVTRKFDRGITDDDINDQASITITKFAEYKYDQLITLTHFFDGTTALSAQAAGTVLAVFPLPPSVGYSEDDYFTVLDGIIISCNDCGDGADELTLDMIRMSSAGAWNTEGTNIFTDVAIDNGGTAGSSNAFTYSQGDTTFPAGTPTNWSGENRNVHCLVLTKGTTSGAGTVDSAGDFVSVTLKIRNALRIHETL